MLNVLIAGIGGQGSVLAAKILAQAAQTRGWHVRTAETIGMAQRGGNVMSHVRMGNRGEEVLAPLVARETADVIIALELGECIRALPYVRPGGLIVTSCAAIPSVAATLSGDTYEASRLKTSLEACAERVIFIDEEKICEQVGSRKVANVVMLTAALVASQTYACGLGSAIQIEEMTQAMKSCVKPRFTTLNCQAIEATVEALSGLLSESK